MISSNSTICTDRYSWKYSHVVALPFLLPFADFLSLLNLFILQIIHTEAFIGHPKVKSAAAACRS